MASGYWAPLAIATNDVPTLTAAAAATCLPTTAKYTWAQNAVVPGYMIRVKMAGRISCVVTTPGTARLDFRIGGNIFFDTLATILLMRLRKKEKAQSYPPVVPLVPPPATVDEIQEKYAAMKEYNPKLAGQLMYQEQLPLHGK